MIPPFSRTVFLELVMSKWDIQVGSGWFDKAPPEVAELIRPQEFRPAEFRLHMQDHLGEFYGWASEPLHESKFVESPVKAARTAMCAIRQLCESLSQNEADVVSLIWLNYKPQSSLGTRCLPTSTKFSEFHVALQAFCTLVSVDWDMGSACEWAIISCHRVPD